MQALFDSGHQEGELPLWRVGPFREGDDVDLAAIETLRDDRGIQSEMSKSLHGQRRSLIELAVLFVRGNPALEQVQSPFVTGEHLGAAVDTDHEAAGTWWACLELSVDIADVGARDDDHVEAG